VQDNFSPFGWNTGEADGSRNARKSPQNPQWPMRAVNIAKLQ